MTDSQLRPPEPPTLSDAHWQRRRRQVMAAFEQARPARRGRRRALIAVVVAALLLVVAAVSAGAYARSRPGQVTVLEAGVGCFASQSLTADVAVVAPNGADPIARCREAWARGDVDRGWRSKLLARLGRDPSVPQLVACVYPTGALAVFPGKDAAVCDRLGLRQPAAGEIAHLQRFDAFRRAVVSRYFTQSECVNPAVARRGIRQQLKAHGLADWRVVSAADVTPGEPRFDRAHPCALVEFSAGDKLVILHADQGPPG
jgi:hypothetical protein